MKWAVSIRSPKAKKVIIRYNLSEAKELARKARKKYEDRPDVQVDLISRTKAFAPPSSFRPRGKRWWCPYCAKERMFRMDTSIGSKKCMVCGISDRDFHVMKYNHLWPSMADVERKVKRKGVLR